MKRFLITGARGFIGSNLYQSLIESRDKAKPGLFENWEIDIFEGDICQEIKLKEHYSVIYHLAANTDPRHPSNLEMHRTNVEGFMNVLNFAMKNEARLIYASTAAQYGSYEKTAYADSKAAIDVLSRLYYSEIKIVGLRFVNVFGPGEAAKGKNASMITNWALQLLANKVPQAFKEERRTKRDYVYVKDAVKALRYALGMPSGVYDVGTGQPTSFDKIYKLVERSLNIYQKPNYIPNPYKGRYQKFTKAKLNWGFKPDFTIEEGIKDYLENEDCKKDLGKRALDL